MLDSLFCQICDGDCSWLDVVDFNKSCVEPSGKFLRFSGVAIYYARCDTCGFCFAPEIAKWGLREFEEKIYNDEYVVVDPGCLDSRPRENAKDIISFIRNEGSINHLDYGGGNGLLSRLLRDAGWRSTSFDPFFDKNVGLDQLGRFNLITAFEVFEHVPNVRDLMSDLTSLISSDGIIFFATLLSDGNIVPNQRLSWWYASPRNGHISLFSRESLRRLAEKNGFNFLSFSEGFHAYYREVPSWAKHIITVK
ncbi:class I SAM-dependent methyltransferase [Chitinimonas sp. PSY-7]|uniref:methyltransferase domain-containing protein n=1 Tax=Chitinimonas sp. PSY-7 TaxID=3459088 RepID=UPI00403FD7B4